MNKFCNGFKCTKQCDGECDGCVFDNCYYCIHFGSLKCPVESKTNGGGKDGRKLSN